MSKTRIILLIDSSRLSPNPDIKYDIQQNREEIYNSKLFQSNADEGEEGGIPELTGSASILLDLLYKKINGNVSPIMSDMGFDAPNDDSQILYRPWESFTHSPYWTAGRYIGEITVSVTRDEIKQHKNLVGDYRIVVLPRLGATFLLHMLGEIANFKMHESIMQQAQGKVWNRIYQLVLRQLWIAKFSNADKYGLPRVVVKRGYQGEYVRGSINIKKSIIPFFTKQEFFSECREREYDDVIGRIVYKAYNILIDKNYGMKNLPSNIQESLNTLYGKFHNAQFRVTQAEYHGIRYKSIYESWKPLVDFSWQIILNKGYNPDKSVDGRGYALFFDMAEIWEAYIGKLFNETFKHCSNKNSNYSLFNEFNQKIIPDYITRDYDDKPGSTALAIADAKYMDLADKEKLEGEQANSVFYKTIMYMHRFNAKKGFIFYPVKDSNSPCLIKKYSIKNTNSSFIMFGLRIPNYKNADNRTDVIATFQKEMREVEDAFKKILTNN